jgi:hypothetical protein
MEPALSKRTGTFGRARAACVLGFTGLLLAACLPIRTPPPPLTTDTVAPPTVTPTSTPVWFPPTPTNTPYPTATHPITATIVLEPEYGSLIFNDDFSDPSAWQESRSSLGSAAVSNNELTLALTEKGEYIYSLRHEPELRDFYLEVTASPSICRSEDEYGLLLHFADNENFFRFSLTCDGQARVDRLYKGKPSSPQPLTFFGAIPPGAPSSSRLAVWVSGRQMDFYINSEYLYTVSDPNIPEGKLGLFIRSQNHEAMTVNFSDLQVYEANP